MYNKYLDGLIDDNKIDDSKTPNTNLIILNELLPDLIKNAPDDNKNSSKILKDIFNKNTKNVVFIDSNIYSRNEVDKL